MGQMSEHLIGVLQAAHDLIDEAGIELPGDDVNMGTRAIADDPRKALAWAATYAADIIDEWPELWSELRAGHGR